MLAAGPVTVKSRPLCFYMDDSGSRHPSKKATKEPPDHDWFALGGILINESCVDDSKAIIDEFLLRWPVIGGAPLHSYDIRQHKQDFKWLTELDRTQKALFFRDLSELIMSLQIVVMACVIDRPGYNKRYDQVYGHARWQLCKSAFTIAVERAAKYALHREQRLRVYVERSDKKTEAVLRSYYDELKCNGHPFDMTTSAIHRPLSKEEFSRTLMEFAVKHKASRLMQIADLVLWPVCKGGYVPEARAYQALKEGGKLLDALCREDNQLRGIKYYCFDNLSLKNKNPHLRVPESAA
jgi:hypothetical protein